MTPDLLVSAYEFFRILRAPLIDVHAGHDARAKGLVYWFVRSGMADYVGDKGLQEATDVV